MSIGAFSAGNLVANGRRKFLIIFGIIGIIGTAITLVPNLYMIVIGRFIHGTCTGVFMTGGPRILDETVPPHLLGTFGTYTNVYANLGLLIVMGLGLGLPEKPQDTSNITEMDQWKLKLKDDEFWRVIYGFPILTLGVGVTLLMTYFR
jgi:MFS family permease